MSHIKVEIQHERFDIEHEIQTLTSGKKNIGAIVSFTGLCRDEDNTLEALEIEHYPGMAEAEITRICELANQRFDLNGIRVIHRYGKIESGDQIVLVITASKHRQSAFDGANFIMDFLKTDAPFWKKNHALNKLDDTSDGEWVSARETDTKAHDKWG